MKLLDGFIESLSRGTSVDVQVQVYNRTLSHKQLKDIGKRYIIYLNYFDNKPTGYICFSITWPGESFDFDLELC